MTAQKCNITHLLSNFDTGAVTTSSQRYGETAGACADSAWMSLGKRQFCPLLGRIL